MTKINLLPWREQERKQKKIRFALTIAGSVGLAFFFIVLLHFYFSVLINQQLGRNNYLQTQIQNEQMVLNSLIQKKKEQAAIDTDLHFIFDLREKSYRAVLLLDQLARVVPEGVTFNKIIREDNKITLIGKAKSNMEVTLLMENLIKAKIFKRPELSEIVAKENVSGEERYFQVRVEQLS